MARPSAFHDCPEYQPRETVCTRGVELPAWFGEPAGEYRAASEQAAVFDRSDRGLVVATGADRKTWLHNLVTNAVTTLDEHQGNYAFAIDVRGRTQFDLNILNLPDALWLDIDAAALPTAIAHLERYLIMEDVRISSASEHWARLAVCGPSAGDVAERLGAAHLRAAPDLACMRLQTGELLVRHEIGSLPGFELILPRERACESWRRLVGDLGVTPAGWHTLDLLRIEAGVPWLGRDIDDATIPPETGQIERGISYHKGCYLGQEVIERMRSHGSLARRLMRVSVDGDVPLDLPAEMVQDGKTVGRLTSLVRHPIDGGWIGLGYLRAKLADTAGVTVGDPPRVVELR